MRKFYTLLLSIAVLATACTTDTTQDIGVVGDDCLTVSVEKNDTRIELLDNKSIWTEGDMVSVFYNSDKIQQWKFTGQTGDRMATLRRVSPAFSGKQTQQIVIVYPYSTDYDLNTNDCNIEAYLPATQQWKRESFGVGSSLMVSAGSSPTENFMLKHVCGWLNIQLTGNGECVEKIILRGNNNEQVAGSIYINTADATSVLASNSSEPSDDNSVGGTLIDPDQVIRELSLICSEECVLSDEPTSFYIALPPQTFSAGITAEIICDNHNSMTKSTSNPITIERNAIQPLESLECQATDWIDVCETPYTDYALCGMYTLIPSVFPTNPTYNVKVQVRADSIDPVAFQAALDGTGSDEGLQGIYRVINPYHNSTWAGVALTKPADIIIDATNYKRVRVPMQDIGVTMTEEGETHSLLTLADFYLNNDPNYPVTDDMYGYIKGGSIIFPRESLVVTMSNPREGWHAGGVSFTIAPKLYRYELVLPNDTSDGDFSFVPVELSEDMLFYSQALHKSWKTTLEIGTPTVSTDDADKAFAEQYGTLYRLPNLYAEGFHIYFCVKDGVGVIPKQLQEQSTGTYYKGGENSLIFNENTTISFDSADNRVIISNVLFVYGDNTRKYGLEMLSDTNTYFEVYNTFDYTTQFTYSPLQEQKYPLISTILDQPREVTIELGHGIDDQINEAFNIRHGQLFRIPSMYEDGVDFYVIKDHNGSYTSDRQLISGTDTYATVIGGDLEGFEPYLEVEYSGDISGTERVLLHPSYTWTDVATGVYTAPALGNVTYENTLQHAEGTDIYRIVNFYGYGANIPFRWDRESNKCEFIGATDMLYPGMTVLIYDLKHYYQNVEGVDNVTWERIEANGYVQPYFDPVSSSFVFQLVYYYSNRPWLYNDAFDLNAPIE